MHVNQKPRRRHSEEFKAQVLAACAEAGASVSAVAQSFGLNDNLVHQWRRGRGRGCRTTRAVAVAEAAAPQFVALSLPAPVTAPAAGASGAAESIRVQLTRGALSVSVSWPLAGSSQCATWPELLLACGEEDIHRIIGSPDDLKLRSCLTLFQAAAPQEPLFGRALAKFHGGMPDTLTLELLR